MPETNLSFDELRSRIMALLNPGDTHNLWTREVYVDHVIYQDDESGRIYQQAYTVADDEVSLSGEPVEVRITYTPV